jgi:hypothetical protein
MFPVAAAAAAGWLILFALLLTAPPPPSRRRGGAGGAAQIQQGDEPPAVVSLLAGRLGRYGFGATLLDLAARGWFRLSPQAHLGGASGPVMCVVCAEPPDELLTPYERRVVAHVGLRAGAAGEVPGPALADGFAGGEAEFMKEFREEVAADARQRGLTRSRLSPGRIAMLCVLLFVPAGTLLAAIDPAHREAAWVYLGFSYLIVFGLTVRIGTSRRCSAAGRAARSRWREAVTRMPGDGGRLEAYAAALGAAPAAVAVFTPAGQDLLWSSYRGGRQQIAVEGGDDSPQQRASHGGLPNPADLVPADEAWWVHGGPVAGEHIPNPAGQTMTWKAAGRDQPMLTVIVRQARAPLGPRPLPPGAWPVPGVTDGYLLDGRAWLYAGPLMMIISTRGKVAAGNEAGLAWLLPRAEARLHLWLAGTVASGDTDDRSG